MKRFAELYAQLDATTSTNAKVEAMRAYFEATPPEDAAWALFFLMGRRFKRLLPHRLLARWVMEEANLPEWLLEECYGAVGDLAETVSLLVDSEAEPGDEDLPLSRWVDERILPLYGLDEEGQRRAILAHFRTLDRFEVFVLSKILTGELRIGVSQTLVVRALGQAARIEPHVMSHRLMGQWEPSPASFEALLAPEGSADDPSRPYPFFLASPLEGAPESLGDVAEWLAEWKWDGIRAQLVRREGQVFLWSRGEELITERFPEVRPYDRPLRPGTARRTLAGLRGGLRGHPRLDPP